MKKFAFVLMTIVVMVLVLNVYIAKDDISTKNDGATREDRIASVLHTAWDEFDLLSFQIGVTDPTIWIEMDETKSEQELLKYLEDNIDQSDLSYYNIEVLKKEDNS